MKVCAKILPMSRTRLTIKISSCKMDSNANFDAAEYVSRNFDDLEDGWGLDLRNLKEVVATEKEMKKILPTLIREADKKKKMMLEKKKRPTGTPANNEKRNKEDEKNVKK